MNHKYDFYERKGVIMKVLKAIWNFIVYLGVNAFYYTTAMAGCIGFAFALDKVTGGRLLDFDPER